MSNNILDLRREGRAVAKEDEGYSSRITLTTYAGTTGLELQLTLGGYPYRFIELDKKSVKKIRDKLNEYLEVSNK